MTYRDTSSKTSSRQETRKFFRVFVFTMRVPELSSRCLTFRLLIFLSRYLTDYSRMIGWFLLTPKIVFCSPNGIGVSLANKMILNALGPAITLNIALPVSFLSNLKHRNKKQFFNEMMTNRSFQFDQLTFVSAICSAYS